MKKINKKGGFTLIEILVVIGIIAVLAAIVIIAINPARQFAQARNSQRSANVNAILNAIGQNIADNKGIFTCENDTDSPVELNDPIPEDNEVTLAESGADTYDIRPCISPTYIPEVPYDPSIGSNTCPDSGDADCTDLGESYNTEYTVEVDSVGGRITVCAPEAANEDAISASEEEICVTR